MTKKKEKTSEQIKQERHERYMAKRDRELARQKQYYKEHREECNLYNAIYCNRNKERLKKVRHAYYLKNKHKWKNLKSNGDQ